MVHHTSPHSVVKYRHVCRRWQLIVDNCQSLWDHIYADAGDEGPVSRRGRQAALAAYVGRAKSRPLHVTIHLNAAYRPQKSIDKHIQFMLEPLLYRIHSWVSLELHGVEDLVHYLRNMRGEFASLRSLNMQNIRPPRTPVGPRLDAFALAPKLREVSLWLGCNPNQLSLPWAALTNFSTFTNFSGETEPITSPPVSLNIFSNLCVASFVFSSMPLAEPRVVFPRLARLRVNFPYLLRLIHAPNLTELSMKSNNVTENRELGAFVERAPGILTLTLEDWNGSTDVLLLLPSSLRHLTVEFNLLIQQRPTWPYITLFWALTLREGHNIVPSLSTLDVWQHDLDPPSVQLQNMLDSRVSSNDPGSGKPVGLKRLSLHHTSHGHVRGLEVLYRQLRIDAQAGCSVHIVRHFRLPFTVHTAQFVLE